MRVLILRAIQEPAAEVAVRRFANARIGQMREVQEHTDEVVQPGRTRSVQPQYKRHSPAHSQLDSAHSSGEPSSSGPQAGNGSSMSGPPRKRKFRMKLESEMTDYVKTSLKQELSAAAKDIAEGKLSPEEIRDLQKKFAVKAHSAALAWRSEEPAAQIGQSVHRRYPDVDSPDWRQVQNWLNDRRVPGPRTGRVGVAQPIDSRPYEC